ncbi:MAG: N-acetyl sugar amidotransferase [Lachnospiraceae bacterium]|nr:N-acetyl sugar amidotransferase [Lachnospiraceae bacterium]
MTGGISSVEKRTNVQNGKYQICTNCVMDTSDPQITFDADGQCDFCKNYYSTIKPFWHPGEEGKKELLQIAETIKKDTQGKKYNCIIGMSGGVDSSYLTYIAKEVMGLNPLIFTVDSGWNLNIAVENIEKIVKALKLDMYTEVVNWQEMKDLQLAFFKSQVPYQDLPQDHAIFAGLYNYAVKNGIKYVLTGGNISTECVKPPLEWTYINDIRMIKDIHRKFGKKPLKTFPLCGMLKNRLYYRGIKGMKVIKPLDYIPYVKEDAIKLLEDRFGWQQYKNKHYENIFTRFYEGYYLPEKFGYDKRRCYFSSLILTGQMTREEALKELEENPYDEKQALEDRTFIAKKLGIGEKEFEQIIAGENKTYRDYKNQAGMLNFFIHIAQKVGIEKRNFR